jgi:MmyB-like transcription regulator ligand binding domain
LSSVSREADRYNLAPFKNGKLAMFRADSARYVGDPEFDRLIAVLTRSSREFRQWWSKREVLPPLTGHKRIQHSTGGRMVFEYNSLAVADHADLKLVVYTPLEEDQTAAKLKLLLRGKPIARTGSQAVPLP